MFKTFGTEVLLAEDLNDIMRQTIIRVPDTTALAALTPVETGFVAYCESDDTYYRRTSTTWVRFAPPSSIQSSDASYPVLASAITAETVIDRITIAAAPYARRVSVSTSVFARSSIANDKVGLSIYSGAAIIGRAQVSVYAINANVGISVQGYVALSAGSGAVIEVRVSRASGTGTVTTSGYAGFTSTVAHITPA